MFGLYVHLVSIILACMAETSLILIIMKFFVFLPNIINCILVRERKCFTSIVTLLFANHLTRHFWNWGDFWDLWCLRFSFCPLLFVCRSVKILNSFVWERKCFCYFTNKCNCEVCCSLRTVHFFILNTPLVWQRTL